MRQPTLLLKPSAYKTNKLYSILPDDGGGDFTVSSYVGNGTRVNSDGLIETVATDTPRIDHLNGCGLLLEPTRTNLMTYTPAATGWSSSGQLTADDAIAPDGTKTAVRHEDDVTVGSEASTRSTTISASTTYTFSIFIKFGNSPRVTLALSTTAGTTASTTNFLNSDGTWTVNTDASAIIDDSGSVYYGDGWYRFYCTFTSLAGNTGVDTTLYPSYGNFDIEPQGYYWFWGNQLEAGAFMTSLIPTVASSLERLDDHMVSVDLSTAGILSNSSAFILMKVSDLTQTTRDSATHNIVVGGTNGRVYLSNSGSAAWVVVQSTDTTTDTYTLTGTAHNIGFNVSWDNVDIWVDGVKVATTSKEFYFTGSSSPIRGDGASFKLREFAIYNNTLTDAEAQRLTS